MPTPCTTWSTGDYWVLSRYSEVQAAVLDTTRYSSANGLTVSYGERAAAGLATVTPLVMMDPPEHTEFRSLIGRGYTPRRVAGIEPQVRQFVRTRLDAMAELGECDIVTELFRPVPSFVVAGYLGVPEADRAQFESWTRGIVEANAASRPAQAADAAAELFGYFTTLIDRRRTEPADDTVSDLVRLLDGDVAGMLRILGFAFTMIAGGNDTVTGLLGGAAELLTTHPDQRRLLLGRPDLLPTAIEELLRLTSPVQCLARTLTSDTTVHGHTIPAGRKVLLLYGSANRDPRVFGPSADAFDILRGSPGGSLGGSLGGSQVGPVTWPSRSASITASVPPPPGCRPASFSRNCSPASRASALTPRPAPSPPGITPGATPPSPSPPKRLEQCRPDLDQPRHTCGPHHWMISPG